MITRRLRMVGLLVAIAAVGAGIGLALARSSGDEGSPSSPAPASSKGASARAGSLTITNAIVRATTNDVAALYFTVESSGEADRLVAVTTDVTRSAMLHQDVTQGASSVMQPVTAIEIPARGRVELKAGGYHVMLMDVRQPLTVGATVQAQLIFEKAGSVALTVPVVPYGQ